MMLCGPAAGSATSRRSAGATGAMMNAGLHLPHINGSSGSKPLSSSSSKQQHLCDRTL